MTQTLGVALRSFSFFAVLVVAGCSAAFSVGEVNAINFATLSPGDTPNQYLVCPAALCRETSADLESPMFAINETALRVAWESVAVAAPRTSRVGEFNAGRQLAYVQRSAVFKFPDVIAVEFFALGDGRSTIAIYSRSVYGRSDFGVNQKRIMAWLEQLAEALEGRAGR
ncbi:MAG: DUF1499 domain-containing protein [Alphaproteobacteria bacterium]|nr:DUF1499 domain-containing protein [Alphaproteobacteria bacterium]